MKNMKRFLIGLGACGLIALVSGIVFVSVLILQAPDINSVDATPEGYLTTILDQDGNRVDTLSGAESNRIYVGIEEIPENLQHAFVAIEDARFYEHNGIDVKGILRAVVKGVTSGSFSQGASTITQQLLKNNVFTNWTAEENFADKVCRKIQEQYLAVQLEKKYDKEWILENYLNTINLGAGTRGVEVASQYYFGKSVSELSLGECALLAGITKNPSGYNPLIHLEESLNRQQLVLSAMKDQGYITDGEYEAALAEDMEESLDTAHVMNGTQVFSWFEDVLLETIVCDLQEQKGYSESDAWNLVYSGGLTICSTQDSRVQSICENVVNENGWYSDDEQVSVVIMNPQDGSVQAVIGGRGEKTASLVYNRATESVRQPGSTLKILGEYAAGLDRGWFTLGTVFDDAPYAYTDGTEIHNASGVYNGTTTVRRAIATSSNVVALKAYQEVGEEIVFDYLQNFGLTGLTNEDLNEALALGGTYGGVTNLQLAAAYNALAAGGSYTEPYYYTEVLDHDGNVLLSHKVVYDQVVSAETAALLTSAMEDVLTYGTGTTAYFSGQALAGKSGTTNDNRDLWFVGYSPNYTCSVWGGYDDNQEQESTNYVKQIWKTIMQQAHDNYLYREFTGTENLERVDICRKCGKRAVTGLCDQTVQGNMVVTEYFAAGTAPMGSCDCHVSLSICASSGKIAGSYCPETGVTTKVYLVSATAGTNDVDAVVPAVSSESCDVHKYIWNQWFYGDSYQTDDEAAEEGNQGEVQEPHSGESWESPQTDPSDEYEDHEEGSWSIFDYLPW